MGPARWFLLYFLAGVVRGFPGGAPYDTCLVMFPKHSNLEQQSGPPPFNITLSTLTYTPGQRVTVTVSAIGSHVIRGIQVRAHRADLNREETVGRFVDWPDDKAQPLNCFGQPHNMITHSNNQPRSEIVFVWRAPEENIGAIIFAVTLVETYQNFWSLLESSRLEPRNPGTVVLPTLLQSEVNASFVPIDWSSCGKTKGCLLYPRHCFGPDCYAAVTFTKVKEGYTFEMVAEGEGYVSVGFSHDTKMGDDQTITCTAQGDRVTVQNGYNHKAQYNERMMGVGLTNLQTMQQDGRVFCRFTRPQSMDVIAMPSKAGPPNVIPFDLSVDFFLFLAWGYTYRDSDALRMHKELPITSDDKINFRRFAIYRGSSVPFYPKVHACLMVVAWMAMAGMTVVLSRYFKEGEGAHFCMGSRTWFQLHRLSACLVFGLTAAGLAMVLVFLKGEITERKTAKTHAYVGFTVVGVVCAQVVFGILHPSHDSRFRFIFNLLHRLLGKSAQILSAATLLLAFQWEWMPRVMRQFATIVLWSWISLQVVAEVLLEIRLRWCRRKMKGEDINLDDLEPTEKLDVRRDPSCFPILLYLLLPLAAGSAGLCTLLLF